MGSPIHLKLELFRAEGDLLRPPPAGAVVLYRMRRPDGGLRETQLSWTPALQQRVLAWSTGSASAEDAASLRQSLLGFLQPTGWLDAAQDALEAALEGRAELALQVELAGLELMALPWELLPAGRRGVPIGRVPGISLSLSLSGVSVPPRLDPGQGRVGIFGGEQSQSCTAQAMQAWIAAGLDPDAGPHLLGPQPGADAVLHWARGAERVGPQDLKVQVDPQHTRLVVLSSGVHDPGLMVLAQTLHRAGVEAVLLSRGAMPPSAQKCFCQAFYGELLGRPASVGAALRAARRALLAEAPDSASGLILLGAGAEQARPLTFRPYPGLAAFEARDQRFFCGRSAEIAETQRRLQSLVQQGRPRILILVGGSGSGKSSLARAGVLPALRRAQPQRAQALMRPGDRPLQALADALELALGEPELAPHDPTLRAFLVQRGRPLLLLVDQLEELFTQAAPDERDPFARFLWSLACDPALDVQILATLRADQVGQAARVLLDPGAGLRLDRVAAGEGEWAENRLPVLAMLPEQLREAIEQPAARVGLRLEPGLSQRLLEDVKGLPNGLPLLALCLAGLWEQRQGELLLLQVYIALGGVSGALAAEADGVVDRLDPEARRSAMHLLSRLVRVGAPGEALDIRRRVRRAELLPADNAPDWVSSGAWERTRLLLLEGRRAALRSAFVQRLPRLLRDRLLRTRAIVYPQPEQPPRASYQRAEDALLGSRLLLSEGEGASQTLELAHEALLRAWPQLQRWVEAERDSLRRLEAAGRWVQEWRERGTLLDKGRALDTFALLQRLPRGSAPELEALVHESAQQEFRRVVRNMVAYALLLGLCMSLLVGVGLALVLHEVLAVEAERTRTRVMFAAAGREGLEPEERAWLLLETQERLRAERLNQRLARLWSTLLGDAEGESHAPDLNRWRSLALNTLLQGPAPKNLAEKVPGAETLSGLRLAWRPQPDRAALWDPTMPRAWLVDAEGQVLAVLSHAQPILDLAWASKGQTLYTAGADSRVQRWDRNGGLIEGFDAPQGAWALAVSPGGTLAIGGDEGVLLWPEGVPDGSPPAGAGVVTSLAWSPDGSHLALGTREGALQILDAQGELLAQRELRGAVVTLAWGQEGLAVAASKRGVTLYRAPEDPEDAPVLVLEDPESDAEEEAGDDETSRRLEELDAQMQALYGRARPAAPTPPSELHQGPALAWSPEGLLAVQGQGLFRVDKGQGRKTLSFDGEGVPSYKGADALSLGALQIPPRPVGALLTPIPSDETTLLDQALWRPQGQGLAAQSETGLLWWSNPQEEPVLWPLPELEDCAVIWELGLPEDEYYELFEMSCSPLHFAWSEDGEQLLLANERHAFQWKVGTNQSQGIHWPESVQLISARWSPDGRWLFWVPDDLGPPGILAMQGDSPPRLEGVELLVPDSPDVAWSRDSATLAISTSSGLELWEVATGQQLSVLSDLDPMLLLMGWNTQGELLLVTQAEGKPAVLQRVDGSGSMQEHPLPAEPSDFTWSQDHSRVMLWNEAGVVMELGPDGAIDTVQAELQEPLVAATWDKDGRGRLLIGEHQICQVPYEDAARTACVDLEVEWIDVGPQGVLVLRGGLPFALSWPNEEILMFALLELQKPPSPERLEEILGGAAHTRSLRASLRALVQP